MYIDYNVVKFGVVLFKFVLAFISPSLMQGKCHLMQVKCQKISGKVAILYTTAGHWDRPHLAVLADDCEATRSTVTIWVACGYIITEHTLSVKNVFSLSV